jgi:hypothetical protein
MLPGDDSGGCHLAGQPAHEETVSATGADASAKRHTAIEVFCSNPNPHRTGHAGFF